MTKTLKIIIHQSVICLSYKKALCLVETVLKAQENKIADLRMGKINSIKFSAPKGIKILVYKTPKQLIFEIKE